jgi:hypothetical protein
MVGVNDGIADLKRHLASTPSAEGYLTTAETTDKMPLPANMQVNTPISSTRKYAQQATTTVDTADYAPMTGCTATALTRRQGPDPGASSLTIGTQST